METAINIGYKYIHLMSITLLIVSFFLTLLTKLDSAVLPIVYFDKE